MSFEDMLLRAKFGDEVAKCWLLEKYKPLLLKSAIVDKQFDEDLYASCITGEIDDFDIVIFFQVAQ